MRFLMGTFGLSVGVLAALLYWWRPAPALISVEAMDWALAYEAAHTPGKHLSDTLSTTGDTTQSSPTHLTLTEFIQQQTKGRLSRVGTNTWGPWLTRHGFERARGETPIGFLLPSAPLAAPLSAPWGYIEVRGRDRIDFLSYRWLGTAELTGKGIPSRLHYPYRGAAGLILAFTLMLAVTIGLPSGTDRRLSNCTAGRGCKVFTVILSSGATLIILPFLYRCKGDALLWVYLGSFIMAGGLFGFALYGRQAVMVCNMLRGKNLLAHWNYSPGEWHRFAVWAHALEKIHKRVLLRILSTVILCLGGGFWLLMQDETAGGVFLALSSIVTLSWLFVFIHRWLAYRRDSRGPGEVFIGPSCVYLNGSVFSWATPGSRVESAEYVVSPFPLLSITYSFIVTAGRSLHFGRQRAAVHVPVPNGKQEAAAAIAKTLLLKKGKKS